MKIKSYGKINLCLWVLKERKDNFCEIRTIFHPVDIYDEIEIEKYDRVEIRASGAPGGDENIVFKVLETLSMELKKFIGAKIYIKKRIPLGGGMGGGSSNAASCIKVLNFLYELDLSPDRMFDIARKIGADVPYFLLGGTASGKGKGDVLERINTDFNGRFYIFYPDFEISTKWAYREILKSLNKKEAKKKEEKFNNSVKYLKNMEIENAFGYFENDFEEIVFKNFPEYIYVKEELLKRGAKKVSLTGTGSCIWAYFTQKIDEQIDFSFGKGFWTETLSLNNDWGVV